MKFKILLFLHFWACFNFAYGQKFTMSGYVIDKESGEKLIGALLIENIEGKQTISNSYGYYNLLFDKGDSTSISVRFLGYKENTVRIKKETNQFFNIEMVRNNIDINEIVITSESIDRNNNLSLVQIPKQFYKKIPMLIGEIDVLKAFQLTPGIKRGDEGRSGIYVRGGNIDQNLFLIDGIPLFMVFHLGGYLSIFEEDAISSARIFKGAFPTEYAGRLSSIVDIRTKSGNLKKIHGNFCLGLISSKIALEGPIVKNRSSYYVSGRLSNLNFFWKPSNKSTMKLLGKSSWNSFYDLNLKLNQIISDNNTLSFTLYKGRDKFSIQNQNSWNDDVKENSYKALKETQSNNFLSSLRWNHRFNGSLFSNTVIAFTKFDYQNINNSLFKTEHTPYYNFLDNIYYENNNTVNSGIDDYTIKTDFEWNCAEKHRIKFGINSILHYFKPYGLNYIEINDEKNGINTIDNIVAKERIQTNEISLYIEDNYTWKNINRLSVGGHLTGYQTDKTQYLRFQPRISYHRPIYKRATINAGYARMCQNSHLLSGSVGYNAADLWIPSTQNIKPEISDIVSFGYDYKITKSDINFTVELYYKKMTDLVELKEGVSILDFSENWRDKVETNGTGNAVGIELLMQKTQGKLTGWIGYSLSKTNRKFANINYGMTYPDHFDRPHELSVVANYSVTKNISLSANWVFSSGSVMTIASARYYVPMMSSYDSDYGSYQLRDPFNKVLSQTYYDAYNIGSRNNYRLPYYHRLDVGILFTKQKKYGVRTWTFSLYNAYNRMNVYAVYFERSHDGSITSKSFTLFPIIPSVSYNLKF